MRKKHNMDSYKNNRQLVRINNYPNALLFDMFIIHPIPAFQDNYFWLIVDHNLKQAVVVDPGDAKPVLDYCQEHQLTLSAILVTHHHWDHIDGIKDLLKWFSIPVYGPLSDRIPQVTNPLREGDHIQLLDKTLDFTVLEVPGHTQEHIAYYGDIDSKPSLFCGDTLFAGGCGRLLGGTHEQLRQSLDRLSTLPNNTIVYCTHEYTLANLAFAQAVEPNNTRLTERLQIEQQKREKNLPTLPTTIELEKQTNPFLRFTQTGIKAAINHHWQQQWQSPEELFAGLRRWKDNF